MDFSEIDWMAVLGTAVQVLLILLVTWIIALLVKKAIAALSNKVEVFRRTDGSGKPLGDSLGSIGSLIVWLIGLVAILEVFNFNSALAPVEGMLSTVVGYLPRVLAAGVVFYIGYMIAKIVRELLTTALNAAGFDQKVARWTGDSEGQVKSELPANGNRAHTQAVPTTSVTAILGNVLFGVIIALIGVAALEILGIAALTEPARSIIDQIFAAIPAIILAVLLLGLGVIIAKFVGKLAHSAFAATGLDEAAESAGIKLGERRVSGTLAIIIQIAIILFFAVMAAQSLNYPAITEILNEVLALGGQVIFGSVIIAAGFFIAGLIKDIIGDKNAAKIAYWVTVVLFIAMGLKFMGIADSIINMAFGAIVIGAALAAALAFGLGGRDAAARLLNKGETLVEDTSTEPSSRS